MRVIGGGMLIGALVLGLVLQLLIICTPFMQHAFNLQMLDYEGWLIALALGLAPLLINEISKIYLRALNRRKMF